MTKTSILLIFSFSRDVKSVQLECLIIILKPFKGRARDTVMVSLDGCNRIATIESIGVNVLQETAF